MSAPLFKSARASRFASARFRPGPVYPVGSRATLYGADVVPLRDHTDHFTVIKVPEGAEVEILGWQTQGTDGARYRVRVRDGGREGWVMASLLKALPAS